MSSFYKTLLIVGMFVGLGQTVQAKIYTPFETRFEQIERGNVVFIGNTLMQPEKGQQASSNDRVEMVFINTDRETTKNSSMAVLTLEEDAQVLQARLYWSARSASEDIKISTIKLKLPGQSNYQILTADQLRKIPSKANHYSAYKDITHLIQKQPNGSYTVADISAEQGQDRYAAWSIAVVYQSNTYPLRHMMLVDGYGVVDRQVKQISFPITGIKIPAEGQFSAALSMMVMEGDAGNKGDSVLINNKVPDFKGLATANNVFNSRVIGEKNQERTPKLSNLYGIDIKTVDVTSHFKHKSTRADLVFKTDLDRYQPVAFALVTNYPGFAEVYQQVDYSKPLLHKDRVLIKNQLLNNYNVALNQVVISQPIPKHTRFIKSSVTYNGQPVADQAINILQKNGQAVAEIKVDTLPAYQTQKLHYQLELQPELAFEQIVTSQAQMAYHLKTPKLNENHTLLSDANKQKPDAQKTTFQLADKKTADQFIPHFKVTQWIEPNKVFYRPSDEIVLKTQVLNLTKQVAQDAKLDLQLPAGLMPKDKKATDIELGEVAGNQSKVIEMPLTVLIDKEGRYTTQARLSYLSKRGLYSQQVPSDANTNLKGQQMTQMLVKKEEKQMKLPSLSGFYVGADFNLVMPIADREWQGIEYKGNLEDDTTTGFTLVAGKALQEIPLNIEFNYFKTQWNHADYSRVSLVGLYNLSEQVNFKELELLAGLGLGYGDFNTNLTDQSASGLDTSLNLKAFYPFSRFVSTNMVKNLKLTAGLQHVVANHKTKKTINENATLKVNLGRLNVLALGISYHF